MRVVIDDFLFQIARKFFVTAEAILFFSVLLLLKTVTIGALHTEFQHAIKIIRLILLDQYVYMYTV